MNYMEIKKKALEELQVDVKRIEERQKLINSLIEKFENLNFKENLESVEELEDSAKFECKKNERIFLLKDFYKRYNKGDKNISIKELFEKLINQKINQKNINIILNKKFDGSKNFIKILEKENYFEILEALDNFDNKPNIIDEFLTNSKIHDKIRITNSVFPTNLEKTTTYQNFQKQDNYSFEKCSPNTISNKSSQEKKINDSFQNVKVFDDNNKNNCNKEDISITENLIPKTPINFKISSSSNSSSFKSQKNVFSKTTENGFQNISKKLFKTKTNSKNIFNNSLNKNFSRREKSIGEFSNHFNQKNELFDITSIGKNKSPYENIKKEIRRKSFNNNNISIQNKKNVNLSVSKLPPPKMRKNEINKNKLFKRPNSERKMESEIFEDKGISEKQENLNNLNFKEDAKTENEKNKNNKKKSLSKENLEIIRRLSPDTPCFNSTTSQLNLKNNFYSKSNLHSFNKKKSFSIKKIIKKTIGESPYNISFKINTLNKKPNKQTSIILTKNNDGIVIDNQDIVSFVSKANLSSNQFFESNLRASIEKLEKVPHTNYLLKEDKKQKRHYPEYDQTFFNNKVI